MRRGLSSLVTRALAAGFRSWCVAVGQLGIAARGVRHMLHREQSKGWRGWTTCTVYLLAGSFVTKVKKAKKEAMGIAEARGGRRGPENVWGAAATAAFCALATLRWPARAALLNVGFVVLFDKPSPTPWATSWATSSYQIFKFVF